ncbi:subtilisin family serine protease [Saccharopolyspora erythraea NRRL 2338]|uniref:S8 family peptidase n=1 Tax=Saccharopolyspora erythraea TaxID=1836 RepID=UPI0002F99195|nr:S8 family serine peptidase [Saccharopolyspora erythraea]PFG99403.1 subtilisin family serine protease [Saccharopolyspora erythraea NRRL 2338]
MSRKLGKHRALRFAGPAFALALLVPTGAAGAAPAPAPAPAATAAPAHFMVVGPVGNLARTEKSVRAAGGTVVQSWPQIGVLVATSTDAGFAAAVRGRPGVQQAGASRNLVEWLPPANSTMLEPTEGTLSAPASIAAAGDAEPLEAEQWDLPLIKADKAHLLSQGDKDVTVGVLDYGIDPAHPDLKPNLDVSRSVSCVDQGIPDQSPAAWAPENAEQDHGTHVAGTVAAARNGIGVAGVAPGVTLASVRVIDDDGFIYPEYAVCGFVWAAEHGFDVTNNSYFVDPWYLWCDSDPDQKAAAEAVRRAVAYASRKDVVTVASAGNSNWDLSKPILDQNSPNNGGPVQERQTGDECRILPAELDGVVTVSSVGVKSEKSYFANYGLGSIDVTAPGGDARQIPQTPSANGRILSTLPGGGWGWKQGTSMSGPHAAGVVALLRSTHPDWNAKQVTRVLQAQADRLTCPDFYDPNGDGKADAVCEGGRTGAGFHGAGMVDALDAVR